MFSLIQFDCPLIDREGRGYLSSAAVFPVMIAPLLRRPNGRAMGFNNSLYKVVQGL
jgi:hypothetical protein